MEGWLEFGRGALFKFSFALMVLGLARAFALSLWGVAEALYRAEERRVPLGDIARQTVGWLVPIGRLLRSKPVYGAASLVFHVGLILVPLFLGAHVLLWEQGLGFGWWTLPQGVADVLTIAVIVTGLTLLVMRLANRDARALSRWQDYLWPPLLVVPFATGYVCSNLAVSAGTYQLLMLVHVYAANLIMVLIPFSKVAHCVLLPLSQLVSAAAWKFPAGAGDRVAKTIGKRKVVV